MSSVARRVDYTDGGFSIWTWCPGCDTIHPFAVEDPSSKINRGVTWTWDGNLDLPTFSPSLLVHDAVHLCEGEHDPGVCEDPACTAESHALGHLIDGKPTWKFPNGIPDDAGPELRGHGQPHTSDPAWGSCHSFLRAGRWEFLSDSAHHLAGQTVAMVPLPGGWGLDSTEKEKP